MTKSAIGILGVGEVGGAIAKIFAKKFRVLKKDLNFDEIKNIQIKVLHVCLLYSNKFEGVVIDQVKKNKPKLVIIHSTVAPGTTKSISKQIKIPIVHSPVMGTHPNLKNDIISFVKIIGPTTKISATLAKEHFKKAGIKSKTFNSSDESELGKILDTTYYGWNIMFNKLVYKLCKNKKLDFKNVYEEFNHIYNLGYRKSKPNVVRPVLHYQKGPIGGHCILPNLLILQKYAKTNLAKFIIENDK